MLSKDWLTEKHIDFEYKKYVLLAYFAEVDKHFEINELYPDLAELVQHYRSVTRLKENSAHLQDAFPKRVVQISPEKMLLNYQSLIENDQFMQELLAIIDFSIPKFKHYLDEGKKIYEFIESQLVISPVGIRPLNRDFGYMFLTNASNQTHIYNYTITIFQQVDGQYRGINTTYLSTVIRSLSNSYESIKGGLIGAYKAMPNPATYLIESSIEVPLETTLLPIAKRMLVKQVA